MIEAGSHRRCRHDTSPPTGPTFRRRGRLIYRIRPCASGFLPSRPVRIIVGYAAGGAPDILARLIGRWLSDNLGQPFVVETKPEQVVGSRSRP